MQTICVFAGAASGARESYRLAARELGTEIGRRGMGMVYGGAAAGMMGICADAALAAGAKVTGVLPRSLMTREIAHQRLTDLRVVGSLHERKAMMSALCDAVVALPGGCGTLDELFEAITWAQLGLHDKPIGMLDADGYYATLFAFLDHARAQGFVQATPFLTSAPSAAALLDALSALPRQRIASAPPRA